MNEINTVYRLIQVLATFDPAMQVLVRTPDTIKPNAMCWIERAGAERHDGEWFAVIQLDDEA